MRWETPPWGTGAVFSFWRLRTPSNVSGYGLILVSWRAAGTHVRVCTDKLLYDIYTVIPAFIPSSPHLYRHPREGGDPPFFPREDCLTSNGNAGASL